MKRLIITFAEGLDAAGATGAGVLSAVGHDAAVYRAPALHCFGYGKSELKCQIPQDNITNNTFVQADTSGQGRVVDAYILILTSKGQYLYDIRKIIGFSDPPLVTVTLTQLTSTVIRFWDTPLPVRTSYKYHP